MYTRTYILHDGSSANSSDQTSDDVLIADYEYLSISITTDAGAASVFTVEGSNDDGFTAAIANRSTLTAIAAQGLYTIDPGARWIRVERNSNESLSQVVLQMRA